MLQTCLIRNLSIFAHGSYVWVDYISWYGQITTFVYAELSAFRQMFARSVQCFGLCGGGGGGVMISRHNLTTDRAACAPLVVVCAPRKFGAYQWYIPPTGRQPSRAASHNRNPHTHTHTNYRWRIVQHFVLGPVFWTVCYGVYLYVCTCILVYWICGGAVKSVIYINRKSVIYKSQAMFVRAFNCTNSV